MVWWCPSVRPGVRSSVSFPHFSPTCFDILSWNIACHFLLMNIRSTSSFVNFPSVFVRVMPLFELKILKIQFYAVSFYMLWHIALKFCICFCFTILQTKFECSQFLFSFVGVMFLLELRILEIHSFPHFSPTCFPREGPRVMSRMYPPYPQRDRKRRLNGAVCRNHRIKRVVPCRC